MFVLIGMKKIIKNYCNFKGSNTLVSKKAKLRAELRKNKNKKLVLRLPIVTF